RRLTVIAFDAGHLVERFGLFVIIALGESVVDIGASAARAEPLTTAVLVAVAAAFVLAAGLWWVYLVCAPTGMRYALATARIQTDIVRPVLSWGHLSFVGSIIAVAVGLTGVVTHPTGRLDAGTAALLFGGTGLYLATFGYTRYRMFHTWAR